MRPSEYRSRSLPVHAGLVVEPLRVPEGGELDQVPVSFPVPGQEDEVVVGTLPVSPGAVPPVPGGHVGLHPDDGLDPPLLRRLLEVPGPVHAAVVGEGQGRHLVVGGPLHQVREAVRTVEKGELGVGVEVDERHGRGGPKGRRRAEMDRGDDGREPIGPTMPLTYNGRGWRGRVRRDGRGPPFSPISVPPPGARSPTRRIRVPSPGSPRIRRNPGWSEAGS
jgi:hypothetical protein